MHIQCTHDWHGVGMHLLLPRKIDKRASFILPTKVWLLGFPTHEATRVFLCTGVSQAGTALETISLIVNSTGEKLTREADWRLMTS